MTALVTPTIDTLLDFMQETDDDDVDEWGDLLLQQSADLFTIATGITEEPTTAFQVRLKDNAIVSLAHWLLTTNADREAQYSPFTSERIGSYSYSKAMQSVAARQPVGVLWFDTAVSWFLNDDAENGPVSASSENVFATSYDGWLRDELPDVWVSRHDEAGR